MRIQYFPTASAMAVLAIALAPLPANAEIAAPLSARTALGLTIYNNNLALVRDTRQVNLPKGPLTLRIHGVTDAINPSSLFIEQTPKRALTIKDINFDAQTLSWDML
ncbi:MAG: DUF4140 domain-containing protein [Alphaproteobacteria bacterium]|nr:DUF4140 domain-containing protein [Alphaproteobacteria bacterium]